MKQFLIIFFLSFSSMFLAQEGTDFQLAQYYFGKEDYQKALPYCKKVYEKDDSKFNLKRYYSCLVETGEEKGAEKLIKKHWSRHREDFEFAMILGALYESQERTKESEKLYQRLVDDYSTSTLTVVNLYDAFFKSDKKQWAKKVLDRGRRNFKDQYPLHLQFAAWYDSEGKTQEMINEYLDLLQLNSAYLNQIQISLGNRMDFQSGKDPEVDQLQEQLLKKIQKRPNDFVYSEMLIWLFIQKKQFNGAIVQAQALDKREHGAGERVMEIGEMCLLNKNYPAARKAFKYVVSLGEEELHYFEAEFALLQTRHKEITEQRSYSKAEILETLGEYQRVLDRMGLSGKSVQIILEKAQIQAFYGGQVPEAIDLLKKALEIQRLTDVQRAEVKMLLADIYVLSGEIWEASLLYMQVDKDFKYEAIGFEAKFKNARIFYYDGDFNFAQSQLDILKQSTSKLIANDAMKLSILITDNYGLDSNFTAMSRFASADLLLEQHQYGQAFQLYDSILSEFPEHGLSDEIMLRKAQAMEQQGKWQEAISFLEELLQYHAYDILADDALFHLGNIYEKHLMNPEKAMEYYKKILLEHKGSLYSSESRKRLRRLRGDDVEDDAL
ncbi:MAG: tetratricopeptide repeat protein [Bacteroidetes bacterium]|nr:MAG: tetratricopeptide repeat protein [Bacteroidota bacterium]